MTPDEALRRIQGGYATAMNRLATKLLRKEMTGREFLSRGRRLVREAHARADYLGQAKAGRRTSYAETAPVAWRRVYREEIEFLRGFMEAILTGRYGRKEPSEKDLKAVKARAALYAKKLTGTANEAWAKTKVELRGAIRESDPWLDGKVYPYEDDDVNHMEESEVKFLWICLLLRSCPTCVEEMLQGWRPLREMVRVPGDGTTICVMNCRCKLLADDGQQGFSNEVGKSERKKPKVKQKKKWSDDLLATKMHTLNLRDPSWRRTKFSDEGLVYVLRDADSGELLKVCQTTSRKFVGRFREYVKAQNKFDINLEIDVFETTLERRGEIEGQIRDYCRENHLELSWDNSGGRLERGGSGIPQIILTLKDWYRLHGQ